MHPTRVPLIVGNWKMNKTVAETRAFAQALTSLPTGIEAGLAPPYTALAAAVEVFCAKNVRIYAQNVHWEEKGAFTGEISAPMLKELGVGGAIVGHSERRQYFGETNLTVGRRALATLRHGLQPIICVGERIEDRRAGRTFGLIQEQLEGAFAGMGPADGARCVVAYEPVWAIGTGETATPRQAQEVHAFIREHLGQRFGPDGALRIRILYGGSVTPDNIAAMLAEPDVDGALVGGASLTPDSFAKLFDFR